MKSNVLQDPSHIFHRAFTYDIECYPNVFTCVVKKITTGERWIFEVSPRRNDAAEFYWFILALSAQRAIMIGFNNFNYDYQVIHYLMQVGENFTAQHAYEKSQFLFNAPKETKFKETVWEKQHIVEQADLFLIHHFNNKARATSLKTLEFNMQSWNIGDLPADPNVPLPLDLIDTLIGYNAHDVNESEKFAWHSIEKIEFRAHLSSVTGLNMMNYNDTKIGKKYFETELEKVMPGVTKKQSPRPFINLNEIILPYISFNDSEFNRVLNYLKQTSIKSTKDAPELKDLTAHVGGLDYHFGTGGMHASLEKRVVTANEQCEIIDVDVTSYYPALAIKNSFFPEHLTSAFCQIYEQLFHTRAQYAKKTPENEMLKLALNGVYGDSNNIYGPFYDPRYTMAITINGQLLICLLAEWLMRASLCKVIQANTDGITILVDRQYSEQVKFACAQWEQTTGLTLEFANYKRMWIRDVNNYVAEKEDGKLKRIGAYAYETARENPATREVGWNKDHSALVVKKAAVAAMAGHASVEQFIYGHTDPFDFMLRGKVPGGSHLELADGTKLQKVTRYIIATEGQQLMKIMPPTKSQVEKHRLAGTEAPKRHISINKGWKVHICDDLADFRPDLINFDWYIQEAKKLVIS